MAFVTIADIRGIVYTTSSDSIVQGVIDTSDSTLETFVDISVYSVHLRTFSLYFTAARLLEYLKTNGELAKLNQLGDIKTQNDVDKDIETYTELASVAAAKHNLYASKTNHVAVAHCGITISPRSVRVPRYYPLIGQGGLY